MVFYPTFQTFVLKFHSHEQAFVFSFYFSTWSQNFLLESWVQFKINIQNYACKCIISFQQDFLFIFCNYNFIIITFINFIYWRVLTITCIWILYMLFFLLFILEFCFIFYVLTPPLSLIVCHQWQHFSSRNMHVNKGE